MFKEKYLDWQKKTLKEAPLRPYELTAEGLGLLRRNIIISTLSLVAVVAFIIIFIRVLNNDLFPRESISGGLRLSVFFGLMFGIWGAGTVLSKSTDYLIETGLWWRLSVDDELQDEWEKAQKYRSNSVSFDWLVMILAIIFAVWLIVCTISYLTFRSLPPLPPFDVNVGLMLSALYAIGVMPLIHAAWTIDPIVDDEASEEDMKPLVKTKPVPEPKPVLTGKQKWVKRIWDLTPYIVGILIAVLWMSKGDGGPFYDIGYNIGQWFGKLVG